MLLKFMLFMGFLPMVMLGISALSKMKLTKMREKSSPFECGFDPQHKMRASFSLRFFLITILFLIFDVEIAVMLPLPLAMTSMPAILSMKTHVYIFLLLTLGLVFEWTQGALEWAWTYI